MLQITAVQQSHATTELKMEIVIRYGRQLASYGDQRRHNASLLLLLLLLHSI